MNAYKLSVEQEQDGRWVGTVSFGYHMKCVSGDTREEAIEKGKEYVAWHRDREPATVIEL